MYPKASLLVRPVSCVSDMAGQRLDAAVMRPRPPGLLLEFPLCSVRSVQRL